MNRVHVDQRKENKLELRTSRRPEGKAASLGTWSDGTRIWETGMEKSWIDVLGSYRVR